MIIIIIWTEFQSISTLLNGLAPGTRFSKSRELFGRISGDIILFESSKRRRLEARDFAAILICVLFITHEKTSFTE